MPLPVALPRLLSRLLPCGALLLAACAAPPVAQDVQRFYPDSDQLQSRTARLLRDDGSPERHGAAESFYPDGHPRSRIDYTHGVPDGAFQLWHPNGALACRGRYAAGRRTGEWSCWDESGLLRERSTWRDGVLQGDAAAFDADGHATWAGHFAHDRRDGTFTAFHANGQVAVRGSFDAGRPEGRFTAWYADGTRADEGRYADGAPVGTWICWSGKGEPLASVALHAGAVGQDAPRAAPGWDAALAPAPDPFDPAAVFSQRPSADEPSLPEVVLVTPRKLAPALAARATPGAGTAEQHKGGPAHVGVN